MEFSDRLNAQMKKLNLKGTDITRATKMSSGGVSHWRNGTAKPSEKYLIKLCKILQVTPNWLLHGEGNSGLDGIVTELNKIPIISSVQAGAWTSISDQFYTHHADEWQLTPTKVSKDAFALKVEGDSMLNPYGFPSIPQGSVVIVDPQIAAKSSDIVVAKLHSNDQATIKKLIVDYPNTYLKPLNPDYKTLLIDKKTLIVGVVKQVISNL